MKRRAARVAIVAVLALFATACTSTAKKPHKARTVQPAPAVVSPVAKPPPVAFDDVRDSAPSSVPDVSRIPEAVPRDEPPGRYGNKSPYTVLGRSYRVMSADAARKYRERGEASWYGTKFHGRLTSSREPYDMYAYSGAHKTLPLPSYVRVRNLDNGRSLILRLNDRGPFHPGRIVDLSYAAAIKLGVHTTGVARVEVETVGPRGRVRWERSEAKRDRQASAPGSPSPSRRNSPARVQSKPVRAARSVAPQALAARSPLQRHARWYVQVGSFASLGNAHRARDRLQDAGIGPVSVEAPDGTRVLHRVRVGPVDESPVLGALERRLRELGFSAVRVPAR